MLDPSFRGNNVAMWLDILGWVGRQNAKGRPDHPAW